MLLEGTPRAAQLSLRPIHRAAIFFVVVVAAQANNLEFSTSLLLSSITNSIHTPRVNGDFWT